MDESIAHTTAQAAKTAADASKLARRTFKNQSQKNGFGAPAAPAAVQLGIMKRLVDKMKEFVLAVRPEIARKQHSTHLYTKRT
jgi:hypothetical protein